MISYLKFEQVELKPSCCKILSNTCTSASALIMLITMKGLCGVIHWEYTGNILDALPIKIYQKTYSDIKQYRPRLDPSYMHFGPSEMVQKYFVVISRQRVNMISES